MDKYGNLTVRGLEGRRCCSEILITTQRDNLGVAETALISKVSIIRRDLGGKGNITKSNQASSIEVF